MIRSLHPLCSIFPRIPDDELQQLVDDIQQNGLREPIVLLDDQVLDGRNRYHACLEAGVQAQFRAFGSEKGDGTDPVAFVLSKNLRRRHLTSSQQAAAVAKAQDWSAAHPAHRAKEVGNVADFSTVAERAAISGVATRTQADADLVARKAPELLDKVIAGELSASAAAKQIRADKAQPNSVGESRPAASEHSDAQVPAGAVPTAPAIPASALEGPADGDDASRPTGGDADPREAQIAELKQQVQELARQLEETIDDNASMAKVFDGNDQLAVALAEAKKFRDLNRMLSDRINGLLSEKDQYVRLTKQWKGVAERLQRQLDSKAAA